MEKIILTSPATAANPQLTTDAEASDSPAVRRTPVSKALLFVRRAHLYLGLLLMPWVLLFGMSGFLFNHTTDTFGGPTRELARLAPAETKRVTGFAPLSPAQLAADAVRQLNEAAPAGGKLTLVDAGSAHFTANAGFTGRGSNGSVSLSLDLTDGSAAFTALANNPPALTKPTFADQTVKLGGLDYAKLGEQAGELAKAAGVPVQGALTPRTRGGPELRFVVQDEQGRRWNTSCDLAQGRLSGRAADEDNGLNFYSAVTRLHKTHHYPDRVGARWAWVLVADITALTLVFWGISGLVMWWQLKPTRVLGVLGLSVAAVLALLVFSGTLADLGFGAARPRPDGGPAIEQDAAGTRGTGQRSEGGLRRPGGAPAGKDGPPSR